MTRSSRKPICRFIAAAVTSSVEYRALTNDGPARLLFLFLLIHPHGGSFHVPGLYRVGPRTLQETSCLPTKAFNKALAELKAKGIIQVDDASQLIWFPSALNLMGPPANPNMVIGYCRSILQLPSCSLLNEAILAYSVFLESFGPAFFKPFVEAFSEYLETVTQTVSRPYSQVQETVGTTYINTYSDKDTNNQINSRHEVLGKGPTLELYRVLEAIGDDASWPTPQPEVIDQEFAGVPSPSREELLACQRAVAGRVGVRDPWAYFFKVLRQNRKKRQLECGEENTGVMADDPFAGYVDGQEVRFHDA